MNKFQDTQNSTDCQPATIRQVEMILCLARKNSKITFETASRLTRADASNLITVLKIEQNNRITNIYRKMYGRNPYPSELYQIGERYVWH